MRYMNPGFKNCFSVIGSKSYLAETTNATNTKTGTAFYNRSSDNYILLDFPASGEIFCKFDFYYERNSTNAIYLGEFASSSEPYNGLCIDLSGGSLRFLKYIKGTWSRIFEGQNANDFGFKNNSVNSAVFHLKWADSDNGVLDLMINDYSFDSMESADLTPYNNSNIKFTFRTDYCPYISNVIISDETVSIKEQLVPLQISGVDTDMTFDSEMEIYTASEVNQSLLASVNVADLISDFGGSSKVTGVAVVGNPAYRTAEGLATFTALTKKNNIVTEYSAANIPTDSDSVVANAFKLDSDTTITDLQSMQIGFKVGE